MKPSALPGNENTFYKSTGVLRLLYPLDDAGTIERLEVLREQWKLTRKKNAIQRLESLGARISDPYGDQATAGALQQWQMANGGRLIINGRVLNQPQVVTSSTQKSKQAIAASSKKLEKLTRSELITEVDEILESDLATNRERIFGRDNSSGADQKTASQNTDRFRAISTHSPPTH